MQLLGSLKNSRVPRQHLGLAVHLDWVDGKPVAGMRQWEAGVHLKAGRAIVERVAKLDNCSEPTIAQEVGKYRDYDVT